jgi:hypothetical protein
MEMRMKTVAKTRHTVENIERLDRFNAQFVELVVHEAQHECRIDIDVRAPHVTAHSPSFGASLQLSSASAAASPRNGATDPDRPDLDRFEDQGVSGEENCAGSARHASPAASPISAARPRIARAARRLCGHPQGG